MRLKGLHLKGFREHARNYYSKRNKKDYEDKQRGNAKDGWLSKELKALILGNLLIAVVVIMYFFDLVTLLNEDSSEVAVTPQELQQGNGERTMIPRIIHQTYKTAEIPEKWKDCQKHCIDLHKGYRYILWTDEKAREFIAQEYPWFVEQWDNYRYPIQRADALRYFVLHLYGGIYIDLDDGCRRPLDALLKLPAFVRKTDPTGVSNDVMGTVPGHPFFSKVIKSLKRYDRNWLLPYVTIMYSTGPLFLSAMLKQYRRTSTALEHPVRILTRSQYADFENSFFETVSGNSWHQGDAQFFKTMARYIFLAVIAGFLLGLTILYLEYIFLRSVRRFYNKFTAADPYRYTPLDADGRV